MNGVVHGCTRTASEGGGGKISGGGGGQDGNLAKGVRPQSSVWREDSGGGGG